MILIFASPVDYLRNLGGKVVLVSHLGRPKKGFEKKYSLAPVARRMGELLNANLELAEDCVGELAKNKVQAMNNRDVLLLENVRFHSEETSNDSSFSRELAMNGDLYVNDAFGTAHRAHSSTVGVTDLLRPSVSGFLMSKELSFLEGALSSPTRPFAAIVGGAKVSSKIGVLELLIDKVNKIFLGGAMVFTFFKARGLEVGNSLVEDDMMGLAERLVQKAEAKGVEFVLPVDVVIADVMSDDANTRIVAVDDIPQGWIGLDNGPKTTEMIKRGLQDCKTIVWNGPMGVSEYSKFASGTFDVAKALADLTKKGATTIVGGGDSVAAVKKMGLSQEMSHISTGGGATLELLEGKTLPGVAALDDSNASA